MKLLKHGFNFYLNSSIHVALSVVSLTCITCIECDIYFDKTLLFFTFFATITGYNFVKYFGVAKFHHRSLTHKLKWIQLFSLFCFLFMCYFLLKLSLNTLVYIGAMAIITFLYAIPFLPKRLFLDHRNNLRSIGGLKVYLIALVWCGVTVFLPVINANNPFNTDVFIIAIQRYIFIIVLMLPFEIRDLRYDSLKLSTIPQKIGVKNTKILGIISTFIVLCLEFFKDDMNMLRALVLCVIVFLLCLLLVGAKKDQSQYYSAFWVEGIPLFWCALLLWST